MKTCSRCKTDLPVSEFHKLHCAKDGLQYACIKCLRDAVARTRNPLRAKKAKAAWYARNRDISLARAKTQRANSDQWRRKNRERVNANDRRRKATTPAGIDSVGHQTLMTRFWRLGLTLDQYHSLSEAQDFRCAICKTVPRRVTRGSVDGFHIDHDHVTGKVRGLLCGGCNVGLGMLKDSPDICELAATYLREHQPSL